MAYLVDPDAAKALVDAIIADPNARAAFVEAIARDVMAAMMRSARRDPYGPVTE